ncbi:hypothetical protein CAOG_05543 [Capsaspora owczarzaki ATCC 30864]|uniref:Uncharacterized protein n=1 Tax=Capsaspora owczarzaki (strain ATCC 30864) TaxID=595528 RepID=A0A0D2WTL3_CAPO3|nr:hypothetical protein CAOG_05543 [Capsaspora owczarzaki ATCC 30864]KJE95013.1 hypothetical protein CAOG_005543 [Capsaspora owczarzaki ATCC 30864]|eukprot:XP_004346216.1 hypothetical protein CAOG_05543 [Capsaspora owczarzaki ATCC 30864]
MLAAGCLRRTSAAVAGRSRLPLPHGASQQPRVALPRSLSTLCVATQQGSRHRHSHRLHQDGVASAGAGRIAAAAMLQPAKPLPLTRQALRAMSSSSSSSSSQETTTTTANSITTAAPTAATAGHAVFTLAPTQTAAAPVAAPVAAAAVAATPIEVVESVEPDAADSSPKPADIVVEVEESLPTASNEVAPTASVSKAEPHPGSPIHAFALPKPAETVSEAHPGSPIHAFALPKPAEIVSKAIVSEAHPGSPIHAFALSKPAEAVSEAIVSEAHPLTTPVAAEAAHPGSPIHAFVAHDTPASKASAESAEASSGETSLEQDKPDTASTKSHVRAARGSTAVPVKQALVTVLANSLVGLQDGVLPTTLLKRVSYNNPDQTDAALKVVQQVDALVEARLEKNREEVKIENKLREEAAARAAAASTSTTVPTAPASSPTPSAGPISISVGKFAASQSSQPAAAAAAAAASTSSTGPHLVTPGMVQPRRFTEPSSVYSRIAGSLDIDSNDMPWNLPGIVSALDAHPAGDARVPHRGGVVLHQSPPSVNSGPGFALTSSHSATPTAVSSLSGATFHVQHQYIITNGMLPAAPTATAGSPAGDAPTPSIAALSAQLKLMEGMLQEMTAMVHALKVGANPASNQASTNQYSRPASTLSTAPSSASASSWSAPNRVRRITIGRNQKPSFAPASESPAASAAPAVAVETPNASSTPSSSKDSK